MMNLIASLIMRIPFLTLFSLIIVHNVYAKMVHKKVIDLIPKQIYKFRELCVMIQQR